MWFAIDKEKLKKICNWMCGIITYLYDDTYLRNCKYLDIVDDDGGLLLIIDDGGSFLIDDEGDLITE